jgi:hypothetical protein
MSGDETERGNLPTVPRLPAVSPADPAREPMDARFRVLWAPMQWLRAYWWAIGAYIGYCAAIWGLALLAGWVL